MVQWSILSQWRDNKERFNVNFLHCALGSKDYYVVAGCIQQYFDLEGLSIHMLCYPPTAKVFSVPLIGKPSQ